MEGHKRDTDTEEFEIKCNQTDSECPFCKSRGGIIWIHGHGQCVNCHKNIEPCCEGEKI